MTGHIYIGVNCEEKGGGGGEEPAVTQSSVQTLHSFTSALSQKLNQENIDFSGMFLVLPTKCKTSLSIWSLSFITKGKVKFWAFENILDTSYKHLFTKLISEHWFWYLGFEMPMFKGTGR